MHEYGTKNIHGLRCAKGVLFVLPYCHKHNTFLQAANKCDDAFTTRGFDNIKKACDRLIQELHDRFGQREVMKPIVTLESSAAVGIRVWVRD